MDKGNHDSHKPVDCQLTVKTMIKFLAQLEEFEKSFHSELSYFTKDRLLVEQSTVRLLALFKYTKCFDNGAEEGLRKYDIATAIEHDQETTSCKKVKESVEELLLQSCLHPELLHDVGIVLSTFADEIKGLQSISSAQYDACQSTFMKCQQCVDSYISKNAEILTHIDKLKQSMGKYREHTSLSESVSEGNANIDKQIEEFEKLEEVVVRFKKGMDNLKEYINQAIITSLELWYRGEPEIYRYSSNSDDISSKEASSVLCWVKADRRTMRRELLNCTLTSDDDIGYKLEYMERFLANPVTLSPTIPLQKHKENILISVPFNQKADMDRKQMVVLTRSSKNKKYRETDYDIENIEGLECVQISLRKFSFFMIVVTSRPIVYKQTIDKNGGTIRPPTDTNVEVIIPPGTVLGRADFEIQTVLETDIPVCDVQKMHPQLLGTSSMVLLRLPKELTGPVNIKIELKHENINFTHAMVHDDAGWASTACDNSSQAPSSYTFQISLNIDRVITILTKEETDEEEMRSMAEAISDTQDFPDDGIKHFCQMNFCAELNRPKVIYVKPTGSEHRGYVHFVAKPEYVGASELKLRHIEGDTDDEITLSSVPVTLTSEQQEVPSSKQLEDITYLVKVFTSNWTKPRLIELFRVLGVSNICTQRHNKKSNEDFLMAVLSFWFHGKKIAREAPEEMAKAFRTIGENRVAETIERWDTIKKQDETLISAIRLLTNHVDVLEHRKMLLLSLGLSDADYNDINERNQSPKSVLTEGLLYWKNKFAYRATLNWLQEELRKGEHIRAADELEKLFS